MRETLVHRGPDDAGAWIENDQTPHVGLAHRRLAILDRSAAGRQPLASADRHFVVVFNGEIYNYRELAREFDCTWASVPLANRYRSVARRVHRVGRGVCRAVQRHVGP